MLINLTHEKYTQFDPLNDTFYHKGQDGTMKVASSEDFVSSLLSNEKGHLEDMLWQIQLKMLEEQSYQECFLFDTNNYTSEVCIEGRIEGEEYENTFFLHQAQDVDFVVQLTHEATDILNHTKCGVHIPICKKYRVVSKTDDGVLCKTRDGSHLFFCFDASIDFEKAVNIKKEVIPNALLKEIANLKNTIAKYHQAISDCQLMQGTVQSSKQLDRILFNLL